MMKSKALVFALFLIFFAGQYKQLHALSVGRQEGGYSETNEIEFRFGPFLLDSSVAPFQFSVKLMQNSLSEAVVFVSLCRQQESAEVCQQLGPAFGYHDMHLTQLIAEQMESLARWINLGDLINQVVTPPDFFIRKVALIEYRIEALRMVASFVGDYREWVALTGTSRSAYEVLIRSRAASRLRFFFQRPREIPLTARMLTLFFPSRVMPGGFSSVPTRINPANGVEEVDYEALHGWLWIAP